MSENHQNNKDVLGSIQPEAVRLVIPHSGSLHYNNEMEDMLSNKSPLVARWGTLFFLLVLGGMAGMAWFIRYPDILLAPATIESVNSPKTVIARIDGKLSKILAVQNSRVMKGQALCYMESIAEPLSVAQISSQIDSIQFLVSKNEIERISELNIDKLNINLTNKLGEVQEYYQTFIQSYLSLRGYIRDGYYAQKKSMLSLDLANIRKMDTVLLDQRKLLESDVALSLKNYQAFASLARDKAISSLDLRQEESKYLSKRLLLSEMNTSIVANENAFNAKLKEIAELESQTNIEFNSFVQSLHTLKSHIEAWEYKYILKSPVSGQLLFEDFFQENQEIKSGTTLFYVQPDNTMYFARLTIPQRNFGKLKEGQTVLLKFQAYPFEQYGAVRGNIDFINSMPTDSGYLTRVIISGGLETNHGISLKYRNGLTARAEIITEDLRLLSRIYYNLVRQFKGRS